MLRFFTVAASPVPVWAAVSLLLSMLHAAVQI
ncbi:hypothetical protein LINPERHAP2_LOCUS38639 [Linum perenne]